MRVADHESNALGAFDQMYHDADEVLLPTNLENGEFLHPAQNLDVACSAVLDVGDEEGATEDPV